MHIQHLHDWKLRETCQELYNFQLWFKLILFKVVSEFHTSKHLICVKDDTQSEVVQLIFKHSISCISLLQKFKNEDLMQPF